MKQPPIFVTGNLDKVKWFKMFSDVPIKHHHLDLTEIQSLDIEEVVEHKAKEAFKILKQPVLIEDTSLYFNALGKLPGTFIKWFLKELGNRGLCDLLNGFEDKSAVATVLFGLYDGKSFKTFEGSANGTISKTPLGENGFGWDPIFILDGFNKTYSQMSDEEIIKTSIRKKALEKLEKYLESL